MATANSSKPPSMAFKIAAIVLLSAVGSAVIVWLGPAPRRGGSTVPADTQFRPATVDRPVPDFSLLNQDAQPVTLADLKGKIWVASFIFTRCHSICPTVSATMAELNKVLPADVALVSFSVDPRHDTPEILAEYARRFDATPPRWNFLTGERDQIYKIIRDGFLLAVEENADPRESGGDLVTHSSRIIIVDSSGIARSTYNSLDPASVELVQRAIAKMQRESP